MPDFDKPQPEPQAQPQAGYPTRQDYQQPLPPQAPPAAPRKRLVRSSTDSWISGVCGGIGEYLGVDANLVRLAMVVATVLGFGTFLIAYVVAWILMPQE